MTLDLTHDVDGDMHGMESPKKQKSNPASPQKRSNQQESDAEDGGSPSKKAKASTSCRAGLFGRVPSSYEDAGPEDKKILQMRDDERRGWSDISEVIEWMTGIKIRTTSLHNRYKRMKLNFVQLEEKHVPILFDSKKEVEDIFDVEKWQQIADRIESKTGTKYPAVAVQKKYTYIKKVGDLPLWEEEN